MIKVNLMKTITKHDFFIIIATIVTAFLLYIMFAFAIWSDYPEFVLVCVDGNEYATYSMTGIKDSKIIEIDTEFGRNVIEITPKSVRVIDASCPDKLDIKCGEITKPNQTIICVPNKMSVSLIGKTQKVDKVTY